MKNIKPLILISTLLCFSCAKTTEDLSIELNMPVVSAFLSPGNRATIQLSRVSPYTDDTTGSLQSALSGISVFISDSAQSVLLQEDPDSAGLYFDVDNSIDLLEQGYYELSFSYNDMLCQSSTLIPLQPTDVEISDTLVKLPRITEDSGPGGMPSLEEIELTWSNPDLSYYMISIQYMEDEYDPVNSTFEIEDSTAMANFSSQPEQVDFYTVRSMQFRYFGRYRLILFHLSDTYVDLFESISQSSLEGLSEPESNITNAKGVFTSYSSDTLYLTVAVQ